MYFVLNQHESSLEEQLMYQEPECFRKTTDKYIAFCTEEKKKKKKYYIQQKPLWKGNQECQDAMGLPACPQAPPATQCCGLPAISRYSPIWHLGDAQLLANKAESEANLRHQTSIKILLVILLRGRNRSPMIPASVTVNQLGLKMTPPQRGSCNKEKHYKDGRGAKLQNWVQAFCPPAALSGVTWV